jgi:riboflavin biosynthesis pyrimidine reductase
MFHDIQARERGGAWKLHGDLNHVPLKGRHIYIAFDGGDTIENPQVILAEAQLARMLLDAGADVRLLRIPFTRCGPKVGLAALAARGLIDEYCLVIQPVALGRGQALFAELPAALRLELIEARSFDCGVVVHIYRPPSI